MPRPEPIGAPSGITAAAPASSSLRQTTGSSLVYGQHDEPFADQRARRLEQRFVVGEQRALVADDFELHPVRQPRLAPEPRGAHRFVGGVAAGGVRQQEDTSTCRCSRAAIPCERSEMFTRRTATVIISAPEASCACTITAGDEYLPVPTKSRERERFAGDCEGIHGSRSF